MYLYICHAIDARDGCITHSYICDIYITHTCIMPSMQQVYVLHRERERERERKRNYTYIEICVLHMCITYTHIMLVTGMMCVYVIHKYIEIYMLHISHYMCICNTHIYISYNEINVLHLSYNEILINVLHL